MNYDHVNKTYDYWTKVRSSLTQRFQASTFDEYLKKFSFCKSGKWLRDIYIQPMMLADLLNA
jgi:hypothetical protein